MYLEKNESIKENTQSKKDNLKRPQTGKKVEI